MEMPLLSVCFICYNQAAFIRQALDSVLAQKVNFSWEIIIADDYSTDGTREIVLEYQSRYPGLIRVLPRDSNLGPAKNFIDLINSAKGKYIAYLEGDDYWTLDTKLQQQVDFLQENPLFAICFTDCMETYSEDPADPVNHLFGGSGGQTVTSANELIFRNYIQTCTVVFRNNFFKKFPDWYIDLKIGDWPFHLLNAQYGAIKFFPDVSAVHRNHSSGLWSSRNILSRIYAAISMFDKLERYTTLGKLSNFKRAKSNIYLSSVKYHARKGNVVKATRNFFKGIYIYPMNLVNRKNPV